MNDFIWSTLSSDTVAANATLNLLHLDSVVVVYLNVIFISIYVIVDVHN